MNAADTPDTPGLIARPPLIYLGSIVAGLLLQRLWPLAVVPEAWEAPLGALLTLAGALPTARGCSERCS